MKYKKTTHVWPVTDTCFTAAYDTVFCPEGIVAIQEAGDGPAYAVITVVVDGKRWFQQVQPCPTDRGIARMARKFLQERIAAAKKVKA